MDVKANEDVPLGVQPPTPPRARRIVPRLGPPGAGMERAWSFVRTFRPYRAVLPRPLAFLCPAQKSACVGRWGVLSYATFSGGLPKWPTGADCKSAGFAFLRSNRRPTTIFRPWLRPRVFCFPHPVSPRKHEGTQGTGHFTVRPCGPLYRTHPLRLCRFLGKASQQEIQERPYGATDETAIQSFNFGTSQTCRGCRENFSLPGCGAAPHIQLSYLLICQSPLCPLWFFVSFVVNPHWQSCVREHVARLCAPLSSL